MKMDRIVAWVVILTIGGLGPAVAPVAAQVPVPAQPSGGGAAPTETSINGYYRSPVVISGEYFNWNGFGDYRADFSVFEGGSTLRFSPRRRPGIQPLLRGGYLAFDSLDADFPDKWDHYHASVGAGLGVYSRLNRNFEIGGEATGSFTQTWFDNLVDEPVGYNGVMGAAGVRISLIPSFNFSIDVVPQVRYLHGLGEIDRFDGFAFALGFGASFRTGRDPDAPQTEVRSIRFVNAEVPPRVCGASELVRHQPDRSGGDRERRQPHHPGR